MKKLLTCALAALFTFSVVGCGDAPKKDAPKKEEPKKEEPKKEGDKK